MPYRILVCPLLANYYLFVSPGVNFGQTPAPVAKSTSIRVLSAYATAHDWELDCFDVKHAFLWGKLQEDVYM
jgi:hypothetical protein